MVCFSLRVMRYLAYVAQPGVSNNSDDQARGWCTDGFLFFGRGSCWHYTFVVVFEPPNVPDKSTRHMLPDPIFVVVRSVFSQKIKNSCQRRA